MSKKLLVPCGFIACLSVFVRNKLPVVCTEYKYMKSVNLNGIP